MNQRWDENFDVDFVISVTCEHRNPDTGKSVNPSHAEKVYEIAHVVPKGHRVGYVRWRVTEGPWEENLQSQIRLEQFRRQGSLFDQVRRGEWPEARHNINCRICGTIVPILGTRLDRVADTLMAAGVETITLHGLKLAGQAV